MALYFGTIFLVYIAVVCMLVVIHEVITFRDASVRQVRSRGNERTATPRSNLLLVFRIGSESRQQVSSCQL